MKPIFSIYPDFWCMGGGCNLMHCNHETIFDGSQFRMNREYDKYICEICWIRFKRWVHQELEVDHDPTGPKEWAWH